MEARQPESAASIPANPENIKWELNCEQHGISTATPGSVHRWDEETEKILRDLGELRENEPYITGDCPVCMSTMQVHQHQPTSKHM